MNTSPKPWITVGFVVVMQAVSVGIAVYSFAFFILPWMEDFQVPRTMLMVGATIQAVAVALLSPLCGLLLDKYDNKRLLLAAVAAYAASLLGMAMAPNAYLLVALIGLALPVGVTLVGPLMAYALVARTDIQQKGLALGVTALGTSLGGLVMPPLVTHLLADHDWRFVYTMLSALTMVAVFLPALVLLRSTGPIVSDGVDRHNRLALMRSPDVLRLGICYLVPTLLFMAILHNLGGLAADLAIEPQRAALVTAGASILMALGKVSAGAMSDHLNHRLLYTGVVVTMAIGAVLTSFAAGFVPLLVGVGTVALALGGVGPLLASIVSSRWDKANFGSVMGVIHALAACSGLGPLLAGLVRDSSGSFATAFLSLTPLLLIAWLLFVTLPAAKPTGVRN